MPRPALKQLIGIVGSTTGTPTSVTASTSSVQLLAANANRAGATIFNASSAVLYVRLGAGTASASPGGYTLPMNSGGYLELPFAFGGAVSGIWSAADGGAAIITEVQ